MIRVVVTKELLLLINCVCLAWASVPYKYNDDKCQYQVRINLEGESEGTAKAVELL